MKVTLVFYEPLSNDPLAGFGYASYRLAVNLHEKGLLEKVICRRAAPDLEIPAERIAVMDENPWCRFQSKVLHRAGRIAGGLNVRRMSEELFDRFVAGHLPADPDGLLFTTRPLILDSVRRAKAAGMRVWLFASVPHSLVNYTLARNEEMRNGLEPCGPISDLQRAERLAGAMVLADRIVTLGPRIGQYVYESYAGFFEPERLLPLNEFCTFEPQEYAHLAESRKRPAGPRPVTFFHVSHLHFVKGITYLLEAWRRFEADDASGSRLVIGGRVDPAVQTVIERDFADLERVEFRGFAPDLGPLLEEADVFVSPSITDAGPVTIIECLAAGLPVISSNNCGFASILTEGVDGFRYEYNDTAALAAIFSRIAGDPDQLVEMGRHALANAKRRSLGKYIEELTELFVAHLS